MTNKQETIQQKIERVKKFGMNDLEVFENYEDEIQVLLAQIAHLEKNLIVAREGLEEIATIVSLGASGRDCGELAEITLMNSTIRSWRTVSGVAPLIVEVEIIENEKNVDQYGTTQNPYLLTEDEHKEWIENINKSEE